MSAAPPDRRDVREFRASGRGGGFTLVEVLVVVMIIGLLVGITLSISAGARERAASDRARAELAVIGLALEEYRRVFGAYPQGEGGEVLLTALAGRARPDGTATDRRPFVSFAALTLREANPAAPGNRLLDPWEQAYAYRSDLSDTRAGYYLYSLGPDGVDLPPSADGAYDETAAANRDNISAQP